MITSTEINIKISFFLMASPPSGNLLTSPQEARPQFWNHWSSYWQRFKMSRKQKQQTEAKRIPVRFRKGNWLTHGSPIFFNGLPTN
jgi:hypothetical protein